MNTLHFLVPYDIWQYEDLFAQWLGRRQITGFFWEVARHDDFMIIEVMD